MRVLLMPGNGSPTPPPAPPLPGPRRRRPAPGRLLAFVALAVILIAAAVPAVSAETIIDETFTIDIDTSYSHSFPRASVVYKQLDVNKIRFWHIEDFTQVYYVDIVGYPQGGSWPDNAFLPEGRHETTYTLGGQTKDAVIYVTKARNPLGAEISTKFTIFFDDWDIGELVGAQDVTLGIPLFHSASTYAATSKSDTVQLYGSSDGNNNGVQAKYDLLVTSALTWKNHLEVTLNDDKAYEISLNRNLLLRSSPSVISGYQDGDLVFTNHSGADFFTVIGQAQINTINISPGSQAFVFSRSLVIGDTPTNAPVTVYVQNSQTGALLANAHLTVLAAAGGTETEVVNQTLPGGTGTFNLEKADYLKYHASATADGYTLLSPILFGVPENGTTIVLWMSPDAPPDEPIEEGKSMLYGYAMTQGSQQPISGATVSLVGSSSTTTSSTGFYMFNNVTPGTYDISASAPLHDALSEPVTVDSAPTQHNLALKGHYLLTISAKDADDLTTLHNTTISLSDGQESTQNPATFSADYGPYTITAAAEGYYPQAQSVYLNNPGTTTAAVLLTARPEPVPPPEMPNYPPHNVRFHCIDDFGLPLSNVSVSAAYLETTSPWSWFTDLLGIPSTVAINETTLAGTTGTDGSITFSMVEVVRYAITAHDPASNLSVNFTLYPQETQYTIQFRTRPPSDAETHPLYELEAVPLEGDTQVSLRLAYKDRDNATTSLLFWVKDGAGEYVYTDTLEPTLLNWTNTSYTVENHPASYTWGFDATHATRDTISAARSITLHGSGRLVDLGFEDEFWYLLLSAIWIVGIGAIFSGSRVRFGAIIIPLIGGGVPTLIGWLPLATTVPIGILTFIGVFVYMRKSEYKLYR